MKKIILGLSLILVFSVCVFFLVDYYIKTTFTLYCTEECKKLLSNCLDEAIGETFDGNIPYSDLVTVSKDENGNITMVQSNTVVMNILAGEVTKKAEKKLNETQKIGLNIPVGYVFGSRFFAERLPSVTVYFRQTGNITSSFSSDFTEAGINQAKHTIKLNLNAEALLMMPGNNISLNVETSLPVCETIILGNVPKGYMDMNEGFFE
ncbi:MAG: sporulation protein YunB [Clostridia bacterium]|nr:sporulation protein YunB [Clostridia bacterium]